MPSVMIIDDNVLNLSLAMYTLSGDYRVQTLTSGKRALELLMRSEELPDLILLDVCMPDMSGFETMRRLRGAQRLARIPVIFLTADGDVDSELTGFSLGASDYITKPFTPELLKKRVELHIEIINQRKALEDYNKNLERLIDEKTNNIVRLQYTIVHSISDLIEKKDGYTGGHTERVSTYVLLMLHRIVRKGIRSNFRESDISTIAMCAKLHDVGKIAIPDSILLKVGKLEPEEFEIIKTHTSAGADSILKSMMTPEEFSHLYSAMDGDITKMLEYVRSDREHDFLIYALDMARSHHEKWNGGGYPDGLSGERIPLLARVTAIADVYDALRSVRTYKDAISHEDSVGIISKDSGVHFDPLMVKLFLELETDFEELSSH